MALNAAAASAPYSLSPPWTQGLRPAHWPRELRDTLFVLAVMAWIVLLQSPHQPLAVTALAATLLLARTALALARRPLPGAWVLSGLVALAVGVAWTSHGSLWGAQGGSALVLLLLALKTLELRARRDALVLFFLGFFALLTLLLHSQSLLTALGMLPALLGLLAALVLAHMPQGRPPLLLALRIAATCVLLGAPLMLALFLLFPRFGPLWHLPLDAGGARSGLSEQMQVGQIARLALDPSIAFRVEFLDGAPPSADLLYFRGPVLGRFDGLVWSAQHPAPNPDTPTATRLALAAATAEPALEVLGTPTRYRLTLEPSRKHWLLTLDATPRLEPIHGRPALLTPDLQWQAAQPITDLTRFEAQAYTRFRLDALASPAQLRPYLELPAGFNPRTLQLAAELRQQLGAAAPAREHTATSAQALIDAVLLRLRTGGYTYTLEPGLFGRHSADEFWFDRRQGFCEHIAASFVILMRALEIPARVVTGYHGGELNPIDGFWTVRQSDAHAWAEVWLAGQGWQRVDPTAHVAPARTTELARLLPPPTLFQGAVATLDPDALARLRALWEAGNNRWNQWVLNHDRERQLEWLRALGWANPQTQHLLYLLGGALALAALLASVWLLSQRPRTPPWLRLLQQARRALQRAGCALPAQASARQLSAALHTLALEPASAQAWQSWLLQLEAQRYDPQNRLSLAELRQRWRRLPTLPAAGAAIPASASSP